MMIQLKKPIYHNGQVRLTGTSIEVGEQHGRTLLRKGYATAPQAEKPPPSPPGKQSESQAKPAKAPAKK